MNGCYSPLVEGVSCKFRRGGPSATETDATDEARYWAKDQGTEGVKNLKDDAPRGKALLNQCRESIPCTGQAIKFAK